MLVGLLFATTSLAQTVELRVDKTRLETTDSLELEIRLQGDIDAIRGPNLEDWEVTGNSTSMQTNIINGDVRKLRILRKTLRPKQAGSLRIGTVQALRQQQVVGTAPQQTITVQEPQRVRPKTVNEASSLSSHRGESVFIVARPSTAMPWEGQPFLLTFELYLKQDLQVSNERSNFPELNGFVVTNTLPRNETVQRSARLAQKRYTVYAVKRDILVPLKTGRMVVEPLELHLVVGSVFQRQKVRVASDPFVLNVRPLPTSNRPPGFRAGNVGEFTLKMRLDKPSGKVGERRVITVEIHGEGNLKSLEAPSFPAVPGLSIERLETVDTSQVKEDEKGMHGSIAYSYLATPDRAGVHTLPPLTLAYFDPVAGMYRETSSPGTPLEAVGELIRSRVVRPINTSALKPLAESLGTPSVRSDSRTPSPVYWGSLGCLLLTFIGFEGRRTWQKRRDSTADVRRAHHALAHASEPLTRAMEHANSGKGVACHQEIEEALMTWILDRHALQPRGLTHGALSEALVARGHSLEHAEELVSILQTCDRVRYAPGEDSVPDMRALVETAQSLLAEMQAESTGGRA